MHRCMHGYELKCTRRVRVTGVTGVFSCIDASIRSHLKPKPKPSVVYYVSSVTGRVYIVFLYIYLFDKKSEKELMMYNLN